jgi:hypothetical protein
MRKSLLLLLSGCFVTVSAYDFGYGYEVNDHLTVGGYFSAKYKHTPDEEEIELDDIAFLMYGNIDDHFSYLAEFESAGTYVHRLDTGEADNNVEFRVERAYLKYTHDEYLSLRVGKFISPVGEWNLIPIVVFRETAQKPRTVTELFPKYSTGVDTVVTTGDLQWNLYLQATEDLDKEYNNYDATAHYGLKGSYRQDNLKYGGNVGWFEDETLGLESLYYGAHLKYEDEQWRVLGEGYLTSETYDAARTFNGTTEDTYETKGFFAQGTYKWTEMWHTTYRYELYNNELENLEHGEERYDAESINLFSVNFKPLYNISLKMEYQVSTKQRNDEVGVVSFSMLF